MEMDFQQDGYGSEMDDGAMPGTRGSPAFLLVKNRLVQLVERRELFLIDEIELEV